MPTTPKADETPAPAPEVKPVAAETPPVKPAETPPAPPPPAAIEGAPKAYEFKAAEGQTYDPQAIKAFEGVARELNLSNKAAQTMLDKLVPALQSRQAERDKAIVAEIVAEARADTDIGGDKFDAAQQAAAKGLEKFGTPALRELLEQTGLIGHKEVIRFLKTVHERTGEDRKVVTGKSPETETAGAPMSYAQAANKMYAKKVGKAAGAK